MVKPMPWYEFLRHTDSCRMNSDGSVRTRLENLTVVGRIVENFKVFGTLKKSPSVVMAFVQDACDLMHSSNDYHNLNHTVDVTQCLSTFLLATQLVSCVVPLEIAAAIIAAICHDSDHPGYSNAFAQSEGNETPSPLETHSVACFRQLAEKHDLLRNLDPDDANRFDHLVKTLILATDMAHDTVPATSFLFRIVVSGVRRLIILLSRRKIFSFSGFLVFGFSIFFLCLIPH